MLNFPLTIKLSGVTFRNAQSNIRAYCTEDIQFFSLVREPYNQYDPNAIRVELFDQFFMGYIPKDIAKHLAPMMDAGLEFDVQQVCVNRHPEYEILGLTVGIVEVKTETQGLLKSFKGGICKNA